MCPRKCLSTLWLRQGTYGTFYPPLDAVENEGRVKSACNEGRVKSACNEKGQAAAQVRSKQFLTHLSDGRGSADTDDCTSGSASARKRPPLSEYLLLADINSKTFPQRCVPETGFFFFFSVTQSLRSCLLPDENTASHARRSFFGVLHLPWAVAKIQHSRFEHRSDGA